MGFRRNKERYAGHCSWEHWRDANRARLAEVGVPMAALESRQSWTYLLLHGVLPPSVDASGFDVAKLTLDNLRTLAQVIAELPESERGVGTIGDEVSRKLAKH